MYTLNCGGKLLPLDKPVVMGIINTTPDSFYGGSRQQVEDAIVSKAAEMLEAGASIVDIGGQSTRPGAGMISMEEETGRVLPALRALIRRFPQAVISIDTYHAEVARVAVLEGAAMINDIGGGFFDAAMLSTVAKARVPYICMHNKGNVQTMHQQPAYNNLLKEILDYFIERIATCKNAGIIDVVIDPGFGFAKSVEANFSLLRNLELLSILDRPILVGISRKSTIYKTLNITADEALNGTSVLNTIALLKGAHVLRVHDVREAVEAIKLVKAVQQENIKSTKQSK